MSKYKELFNSLFFRVVLAYIVIIILVVLGTTGTSVNIFIDKFMEEMRTENTLVLEQFKNNVDNYILKAADNLIVYSLAKDEDIKKLFNTPLEENQIYISRVYEKISRFIYPTSLFHSVFVYYKSNKVVVSNFGESFPEGKVKPSQDTEWLTGSAPDKSSQWVQLNNFKNYANSTDSTDVVSYIRKFPFGVKEDRMLGAFAVNIEAKELYGQVKNLSKPVFGDMFILDEAGRIITNNQSEAVYKKLNQSGYIQKIADSTDGRFQIMLNAKSYYIFYTKSFINNWHYVNVIPLEYYKGKLDDIKRIAVVIAVLAVFIPILIVFVWTRNLFNPLSLLIKRSKTINSELLGSNQMRVKDEKLLDVAFNSLVDRLGELQKSKAIDEPEIKNNLLGRLFTKKVNNIGELEQGLKRLNINFSFKYFWCIYIKHNLDDETQTAVMDTMIYNLNYFIENIELQDCVKVATDILDGCTAVLVNANDFPAVTRLARDIFEYGKMRSNCYYVMGIGNVCENLINIHESYAEAKDSIKYAFVYTNTNIFIASDTRELDKRSTRFQNTLNEEFQQELNQGNFSNIKTEIDIIFKNLTEGQYSYNAIQSEIFELFRIANKRMELIKTKSDEVFDSELTSLFSNLDNIFDVKQLLLSLCEKIIILESETNNNKTADEVNKIKQYITKKVFEGLSEELNLIEVSEYFGKNPNYLSTVFSEYVGVNFKDFIIDVKLTKAEKELHNPHVKINDLANELGYYNVSYFIKIFKRKYGYTPKQYHDQIHIKE